MCECRVIGPWISMARIFCQKTSKFAELRFSKLRVADVGDRSHRRTLIRDINDDVDATSIGKWMR